MFFGVSVLLNLEAVAPLVPVALKLSICSEPPPSLASAEEESFSTLSGAPTQAIAAIEINKPNINVRLPIINRTAGIGYGFNKICELYLALSTRMPTSFTSCNGLSRMFCSILKV